MVAVLFAAFGVLLFVSAPIFIALAGSSALGLSMLGNMDLVVVIQRLFSGINKFSLVSIPFFILAANLMGEGGISKRLVRLISVTVARIPGGLGMATIVTSLLFGAISGSSPATVVAIGGILYPELRKRNYPVGYCLGVITAAGSLGIIIPPSVNMIIYGTVTGASVGALFMSGIGAGIIYALSFIAYTFFMARRHPEIVREEKTTRREKLIALKESLWGLGIPIIILGGIYGGFFTPTEASAVSAIYALIVVTCVYREMNLKQLVNCIINSAVSTVVVLSLTAAASIFGWVITSQGVITDIGNAVLGLSSNRYVILILMNIVMLIAGMFIDGASMVIIIAPLFYSIGTSVGIDPIHLGIIMTVNCAVGMFTPPFGLNLFVAANITNEPVLKVARGCIPFIILAIIALLIVTYVPQISMFIPNLVYGS